MSAVIKMSFPEQAPRHQSFLLLSLGKDSMEGVGRKIRPKPSGPLGLELTMQIQKERWRRVRSQGRGQVLTCHPPPLPCTCPLFIPQSLIPVIFRGLQGYIISFLSRNYPIPLELRFQPPFHVSSPPFGGQGLQYLVKLEKRKGTHPTTPTTSQTSRRAWLQTAKKSLAWAAMEVNLLQKVKLVQSAQVGGGGGVATDLKQHSSPSNSMRYMVYMLTVVVVMWLYMWVKID